MVADNDQTVFPWIFLTKWVGTWNFSPNTNSWRTAIPFLRRYVISAAKKVGADLIEKAALKI